MAFFQSAVGTLQTFVIALRRNGRMSLTRTAAGGESCRAGFFFKKRELSFSREGTDTSTGSRQR